VFVVATIGWPDVTIALIAGLPSILAAVTALLIRRDVHTKGNHTLAQTVEHAHDKTVETNAIVKQLNGELHGQSPEPEAANG